MTTGVTPLQWPDRVTGALLFLGLAGLFLAIGGGPVSSDELKYLAAAVDTAAQPHLLNRYVHIWLEKGFIALTGDVRSAMALFWAVTAALTTSAVWFATRLLNPQGGRWVAALAVFLFLLQPVVFRYLGVTYADYTVMLWVTLAVVVCLAALGGGGSGRTAAFLLGALLVLALRSKETGIVTALLPLALCWRAGRFSPAAAFGLLPWWLLGGLLLQLLLMSLDALLLGDFWFSLRPANIQALLGFNLGAHEHVRGNWFSWLMMSDLALPFLFYAAGIARLAGRGEGEKMLWLLPLALILFLTLTNISGRWNIIPRYLAPVIPLICVLAAGHFAQPGYRGLWRLRLSRPLLAALAGVALVAALALGWSLRDLSSGVPLLRGWEPYTFVINIHYPLVLALVLAAFLLLPPASVPQGRLLLALLLLGMLPMLAALPNNLGFSSRILEQRLQLIRYFAPYMQLQPPPRILLSPEIGDRDPLAGGTNLLRFYLDPPRVLPAGRMLSSRDWPPGTLPDYALTTPGGYRRWLAQGLSPAHEVRHEPRGLAVLVCLRPCREVGR